MVGKKDYQLFISTCDSADEARKISRLLLEAKLVACVNILPNIESHYWWQDKITTSQEWLLVMKGPAQNFTAIEGLLQQNHSYDVPELLAFKVEQGLPEYLQWIDTVTS
jgi:periplasmic divalent cation tolerance protein